MSLLIVGDDQCRTLEFVQFRHPSDISSHAAFAFGVAEDGQRRKLFELVKCEDSDTTKSAFVGNSVVRDGILYLLTEVDVNLVLLGLLEENRSMFVPVPQLLSVQLFPAYRKLLTCTSLRPELISDSPNEGLPLNDRLIRLSDDKALKYLKSKVERTSEYIFASDLEKLASCGTSAVFITNYTEEQRSIRENIVRKESERIALQILFDYLPSRWRAELAKEFSWTIQRVISVETYRGDESVIARPQAHMVDGTWEEQNGYAATGSAAIDAMRFGTKPDLSDVTQKRRKVESSAPSASAKKLAQVKTKGVPSISSFFSAKPQENRTSN